MLAVTHGAEVRAELFGEVATASGHELLEWEIPTQGRPPAGFDAVLVLGGSMNVGEEAAHPWLNDEYELLHRWVETGTPLFCICLGAQTLAHAFGGQVTRTARPQMGFAEVRLTDEGRRDQVLGVLPERFEALLGNEYGFEVPAGAVELATSDVQSQGFRLGERAWAVQFHPEARRDQFLCWFEADASPPRALEEVRRELDQKIEGWHDLGRALCSAFLDAAAA